MTGRGEDASRPALVASLVIPAYNESLRLADGLARLDAAIAAGCIAPDVTEFVLVDDGSTDDTSDRGADLFGKFPHVRFVRLDENKGKGAAVRAGMAVASAPLIAFCDADMSIDPDQMPEFLGALDGADVAIGTRSAAGASVDRPSMQRSVMNRTFNRMVNMLTRVSLSDTQCGFKAFRAPVGKLLFHCSVTERFAFDVEILSLARRLGLTIAEVPVHWSRIQGSRVRPWLDPGTMTRDVYRASRRSAVAPPVPALVFDGDAVDPAGVARDVAPFLPVLVTPTAVTVLCPLMADEAITALAGRLAGPAGVAPDRRILSVTQLVAMAPLHLDAGV